MLGVIVGLLLWIQLVLLVIFYQLSEIKKELKK